eukprot:gene12290-14407_t
MRTSTFFIVAVVCVSALAAIAHAQDTLPNIIPLPQKINQGSASILVDPRKFTIATTSKSVTLGVAIKRYQSLFFPFGNGASVVAPAKTLQITVASDSESLYLGVDESYSIHASTSSLLINANTIYGAIRALETFSQIVTYTEQTNSYAVQYVPIDIEDYPRFQWRGFLVDSGRHYLPVNFLLHIIDSLGYSKFNTLHWHIVDAQSFPVVSKTFPKLTQGAFNPVAIYTAADIAEVVAYAKTYGIRVVPEFDIPGHSDSWGVGYPELISQCPNYADNVNSMLMNPALNSTYDFIKGLFSEISPLMLDSYFHTGGDEVILDCWNEDPSVVAWMNANGFTTVDAEQYFEDQVTSILAGLGKTKVVWNDPFQNGVKLAPDTVIQVWDSTTLLQEIINQGYRALVSFAWYLDEQIPDGVTHYEWQDTYIDFYNAEPLEGITMNADKVLGGEACMWGEQVNQVNWDVRVWPRSIPIGERLWSDVAVTDLSTVLPRIEAFSCAIARRGVQSGPLFPDFCLLPENLPSGQKPLFRLTRAEINEINAAQ